MTDTQYIGERIKFFRERRSLTQKQLGSVAGIIEETIRKYEIGQRNPKPNQLKKIADALGMTVYALSGFDIETDADVVSMILAIDEKVGIKFEGDTDKDNKIKPKTLTLHIDDYSVNEALARWADAKNLLERMRKSRNAQRSKEKQELYDQEIATTEAAFEEAKLNLLISSKLVGKERDGITVKINPDYSTNNLLTRKSQG
jgi:transcriptional regulator with XRE-family HTH domain